jgi:hypothetical protein
MINLDKWRKLKSDLGELFRSLRRSTNRPEQKWLHMDDEHPEAGE